MATMADNQWALLAAHGSGEYLVNPMSQASTRRPWMRVQLQRDDKHYDSWLLYPDPRVDYVMVRQVVYGLRVMARNNRLPRSQRGLAEAALARVCKWVEDRPGNGGWVAYDTFTELFEHTNAYEGFRLDIENLIGHNLRS